MVQQSVWHCSGVTYVYLNTEQYGEKYVIAACCIFYIVCITLFGGSWKKVYIDFQKMDTS